MPYLTFLTSDILGRHNSTGEKEIVVKTSGRSRLVEKRCQAKALYRYEKESEPCGQSGNLETVDA